MTVGELIARLYQVNLNTKVVVSIPDVIEDDGYVSDYKHVHVSDVIISKIENSAVILLGNDAN